jgi:hypothetical protein
MLDPWGRLASPELGDGWAESRARGSRLSPEIRDAPASAAISPTLHRLRPRRGVRFLVARRRCALPHRPTPAPTCAPRAQQRRRSPVRVHRRVRIRCPDCPSSARWVSFARARGSRRNEISLPIMPAGLSLRREIATSSPEPASRPTKRRSRMRIAPPLSIRYSAPRSVPPSSHPGGNAYMTSRCCGVAWSCSVAPIRKTVRPSVRTEQRRASSQADDRARWTA